MRRDGPTQRLTPECRKAGLITAAKTVLAKHGPRGFNVSNIAKEGNIAVGLISYYFGGIDGLFDTMLKEVATLQRPSSSVVPTSEVEAVRCILDLVDRHFDPDYYGRENMLIWIPVFEHFSRAKEPNNILNFRDDEEVCELSAALSVVALHRKLVIDERDVSRTFFSLLDGLWLRWCYSGLSEDTVWERATALKFLETIVGPLVSFDESKPTDNAVD